LGERKWGREGGVLERGRGSRGRERGRGSRGRERGRRRDEKIPSVVDEVRTVDLFENRFWGFYHNRQVIKVKEGGEEERVIL